MTIKIAPSLLGADFGNLERQIKEVDSIGVDMLHIDVMDGNFVPNIAFGPDQVKSLRKMTHLTFDVHMMVHEPDRLIPNFADAGADIITVHQEATRHLHRSLSLIKSYGIKAGAVLNPATPVNTLEYVLDEIDMILLMSVNPGYGGQHFIESCVQKVRDVKELIGSRDIQIQVDGGINLETGKKAAEAGADILVAGSFIFKGNIRENILNLKEL